MKGNRKTITANSNTLTIENGILKEYKEIDLKSSQR